MIEVQEPTLGHESRLSRARAEFVATLGRRLTALRNTLRQLEDDPSSRERRDMLLRRVHALGAAARVLGFDGVADALDDAERALARSAGGGPVASTDLAEVSRALDVLPSIAWGAKAPARAVPEPEEDVALVTLGWPLSILVYGPSSLRQALVSVEEAAVECEVAEDTESFRELAQRIGPDVAVIDGDQRGARELLETLAHDPLVEPFPVIVVGTFEHPEAASSFVAQGAARVLPKPVGPDSLHRAVMDTSQHESGLRGPREPVGDVTVDELAARIAAEVRRGLVDGVEPGGEGASVPLGEGTDVLAAVWGAVARIRELVTMRSGGSVRFHSGGPEGAVPLAPWTSAERRAGERGSGGSRRTDGVRLEGRRAVVVDDDPAVVWFLSGLLRTSGVEVAEAHDGLRARDMVFDGKPDLVVSDVLMPGLDGFTLCHQIKRDVAVRDVPVILLSWKEDLLQRVRELGAQADGYLRKEAAASTVLQRVREVLRPRARVEARLISGGEVRGRLDGLTTRLLLELAERYQPDCRIVVRDAVYLYELEMRGGRPRQVTRTAADGSFERGSRVLDSLVGVSAGRFVVTPSRAPCRDTLDGGVAELLGPRIRRARALVTLVDGRELEHIDSVGIDEETVGGYLRATPDPARRLFQRLLEGASPRELLEREPSSRHFLEQILADVARRSAIREIVRDGKAVDLEQPAPSVLAGAMVTPDQEPPMFTLELSAAPPEVEDAVARWEQVPSSSQNSAKLPLSRTVTPLPVQLDVSMPADAGFRDEPRTNPGVGPPAVLSPAPAPVQAARPEPPRPEPRAAAPSPKPATAAPAPTPAPPEPEPAEAEEDAMEEPVLLTSRSPKAASAKSGAGFAPVTGGVELPASAYPTSESREGDAPDHLPSTLRVDAPPESPASADSKAEEADAPEVEKPAPVLEREASKRPRRQPAATLPSARPIEFPRARTASERPAVQVARVAAAEKSAPAKSESSMGVGRIALMTLVAAGLSFGVVTLIRNATSTPQTAPVADSAAPPIASAVPAVKAAPAKIQPQAEELGLPAGVAVDNEKGLLEVDIADKDAIYVDGTFVGRGPMRRVPLGPGSHQVVLKAAEGESSIAVEIRAGRRTRVTLPVPK